MVGLPQTARATHACRSLLYSSLRLHPMFARPSTNLVPWFRRSCSSHGPDQPHRIVSRPRKRRKEEETARTNVTTTKSLGFCFEEACLSAAHANAARAMGSMVSEESNLWCKRKSATTGSEGSLLRRSDREYTFVNKPATLIDSFITSVFFCFGGARCVIREHQASVN